MSNQFTHPWSETEDSLLAVLLSETKRSLGGKVKRGEMVRIASYFPGRSIHAVEQRVWLKDCTVQTRQYQPWTDREVATLRELYAGTNWRLDSQNHFPNRDPRDVREKARQLGLTRRQLKTEAKELTEGQRQMMAGLLMGDGCLSHRINVDTRYRQSKEQHMNSIAFTNTDPALVKLFASMASNCRVRGYSREKKSGFRSNYKTHYECNIGAKEAVEHTVKQILPFLVGRKLEKAKEMLRCLGGNCVSQYAH